MDFFHTPPELVSADTLTIKGEEFSHLTHVMRKRQGDRIMVVDGAGSAYEAAVGDTTGRSVLCRIEARHRMLHEAALAVHLGVALLKNTSKFDFLVEKCTELGVASFTPLVTERTIPRSARVERWRKITLAAMKQSGRCVLPAVMPPVSLEQFCTGAAPDALRLILHEKPGTSSPAALLVRDTIATTILLCIGPEGGFSEDEIARAGMWGFVSAGLGPRRLRTETAAIAAAAVCLAGPSL